MNVDLAEHQQSVAVLARVEDQIERLVGDHDFRGYLVRHRVGRRTDLQSSLGHDRDRASGEARVYAGREDQAAADLERIDSRVAYRGVSDDVAVGDRYPITGPGYLAARPNG